MADTRVGLMVRLMAEKLVARLVGVKADDSAVMMVVRKVATRVEK